MENSVRVLHIDDYPGMGKVVKAALEQEDDRFTVCTETSAEAGLDRLMGDGESFDCIVSDYDMPEKDGIEFLSEVREEFPKLPFLLFTGKGSEEVASDAFAAGANDYLQKQSGTDQYQILANRILNAYEGYRAEQELEKAKDLYRTTLWNMSDTVLITDDDGDFTYVCPNVHFIFGYSKEEVLDFGSVDELFDEHLFDQQQLDAEGELSNIETQITTDSGEKRTVLVTVKNVDIHGGTTLYTVRDITKRKEHEQNLELRSRAMNEAPVGICMTDPTLEDNPMVYVNEKFEQMTGYSADEACGENPRMLQGAETDAAKTVEMRQAIDAGQPFSGTLKNYRSDGTEFWNHISIAPIAGENGEVQHFVGFQEDVTEQKEREQELRCYKHMIHNMREAACIYDEDGKFELVNEYLAEFYGTTRSELEGQQSNLVPLLREQYDGDPYQELLDGHRDELCGTFTGQFPVAGEQTLSYRLTPLSIDGDIEGIVAVAREVGDGSRNSLSRSTV